MISEAQFQNELEQIIKNAIREDVGSGDYSSLSCIPTTASGKAKLLVKDNGIIAGVEFAKMIFKHVDANLNIETFIHDGAAVNYGDVVFHVTGSSQSILKAERLVLNSMQRMSAIATKTNTYVQLLAGTKTKILDTRKTTPGFRACEKWAVKIGGGENHRFAIAKTKAFLKGNNLDLKIIVEARTLDEIKEILQSDGIFRILIDNFNYEDTRKAVELIGNTCATESSGNINEDTIRRYADCGVDYISSGALTHSIYNMDLSLKAF